MTQMHQLLSDSKKSLGLWRVWIYLGKQDIKARFRRSLIGPLWIFLNMAFFVGGAGTVYGMMFGQPMREFLPFLTTGFVIWGLILASFTESGLAFINAEGYIKQFSYPKQIYLLRTLVSQTIVFSIGLFALIPLQTFFGDFHVGGWLLAAPGLLLLLLAALGHITISAYLGTRFRDLPHALAGLLQVMFFVTPIMFPHKILKDRGMDFVFEYNPLFYLIDIVRHPILAFELAPAHHYLIASIYVLMLWGTAAVVARKLDKQVVFLL